MIRRYQPGWLRSDLVAGIVLAAILVPQGMAYAELAGLPAVNGLYATMACLVGYALFGPSRILVLGPDSSLGPLILLAILPLAIADDPAELVALGGMLALLVAAIEIGLGLGKLGFVADLLSKEVQVGYMIGLGITIIVGQLPKLFGFSTDADEFLDEVRAFFDGLDARNGYTLAVGLASLALLLILPRFTRRIPAVLITVVLSTLAVALLGLTDKGVTTVGSLPQGLPRPQFPVRRSERHRGAAGGGNRHHPRVARRHHRDLDELRRQAWRRGEREPGDDRDRRRQRLLRALPGIPRLHERIAYGSRRAERRQEPGDRAGWRGAGRDHAALPA